tara:strand:+ start:676 stop:2427 length:1752 start_codon:yes stop_codon:yes gene_type:complete
MKQIIIFIKNIMKIKLIISLLLIINIYYPQNTNNSIIKKKESLNVIDQEINELEADLVNEIKDQEQTKIKRTNIENKLESEKINLSNNKYETQKQAFIITNNNNLLDSLKIDYQLTINQEIKTQKFIAEIDQRILTINKRVEQLNDSINYFNKIINQLELSKQNLEINMQKIVNSQQQSQELIKKLTYEILILKKPTTLNMFFESFSWDKFVLQTTIYEMLIKNKEQKLNKLTIQESELELEYKKLNQEHLYIINKYDKDTSLVNGLNKNKKNMLVEQNNYKNQLKKLTAAKVFSNELINQKEAFIAQITNKYEELIAIQETQTKKINTLKNELKQINKKDEIAIKKQKKIEQQLILKKESRKKISEEIDRLLKKQINLSGKKITSLKGKLPWPINGNIITEFGIKENPNTKILIDYTWIEIEPKMTDEEKKIYLAKKINPKNPDEELVQQFQILTMNMKKGDKGYGVFGPKTTNMWQKINKIQLPKNSQIEPIFSIHDGVVESIGFINPIVGVAVIINHGENILSIYNGNLEIMVIEGQQIKSGQQIGVINKQNILSFQLCTNNPQKDEITFLNPKKWLLKK